MWDRTKAHENEIHAPEMSRNLSASVERGTIVSYKEELIQTIRESDRWPSFDRPDFLDDLNTIADDAFEKKTIEGYLAALLVYHQLCEELVRLILKDAQFSIQLGVFPAEIVFPEKRNMMFGQLIKELNATVCFENKEKFIDKCLELNKRRIEIVHNLTRLTTLERVGEGVSEVKYLFDEIFGLFEAIHDYFRVCFKDFRKDVEWDSYLNE